MSCLTCRHFRQREREDAEVGGRVRLRTGSCRRFPPRLVFDPRRNATASAWPSARTTDSCGEYAEGSPEGA